MSSDVCRVPPKTRADRSPQWAPLAVGIDRCLTIPQPIHRRNMAPQMAMTLKAPSMKRKSPKQDDYEQFKQGVAGGDVGSRPKPARCGLPNIQSGRQGAGEPHQKRRSEDSKALEAGHGSPNALPLGSGRPPHKPHNRLSGV